MYDTFSFILGCLEYSMDISTATSLTIHRPRRQSGWMSPTPLEHMLHGNQSRSPSTFKYLQYTLSFKGTLLTRI
jgi:hypothetical protein